MIGVTLGIRPPNTGVIGLSATALSPLRGRLASGQNATIFVNGDSTAHAEAGPFQQFAMMLGDLHDAKVVLHRWAEWGTSAATGPRAYADPVTLRTGKGATLTIYLATLPGGMAGYMLAEQRAAALNIPRPDLCIMHQGHNMQTFETPGGILSSGRSTLLGPLGMTEWQWPGAPQLITTQNPWRDGAGYDKVYQAILELARAHPNLTLVDTHAAVLAKGKDAALYRDNIHPNDTGSRLIARTLFDAYLASASDSGFQTPCWPRLPAANLIGNGDFTDWSGSTPTGWGMTSPGSAARTTDVTFSPSFAGSLVLYANGNQTAGLTRYFRNAEAAAMIGKSVSFAVLYKNTEKQRLPYITLVVKSGGAVRTIACSALQFGGASISSNSGWMWAIANGIIIDPDISPTGYNFYLRILPAFGTSAPISNEPIYLQRVIAVEGDLPKGNLI
ncbi:MULTISPECIES: SGNH/GDSL hydrolase family protein [unclassified Agrobacterium]|uniref:SGNH/GDSL hydrolase family protein n=1 Tax=unclassified Agrobacterium TaxID=2632611 RepID=UPI00244A026B|nr:MULTISPECIES: SGNH/GDSL hydrolase family protein [unclassified Agrobacterium]MDH0612243.1 SGNH/GDSL hydrolase family protein [Agrobacterium sp. GD03872]MDH0696140.1 SGNH/GDSL hydrolase family protein [Agrobacterium sp. GD03871]MDH1059042.1 SGNH/GDSL hydrolase family protein [Agrobacterium sp. GD03992]MDH2210404.1 SGNH/GDSL hydrolase family protein [Agrobacterium sp. GD03643]MDH2217907.1 SGNH/GDSL hydrolase family protein [Agrobacterium sp. GD03638]